ncbi:MAG: hypothetical protein GC161_02865 [Planctomycetaceae bacterium]|nr:hypothetical protein [Planctomycetaceae bacterium]
MRVLDELRLERWMPDMFQSRGTGAEWIRLTALGVGELSNRLQAVQLETDPIEWVLCEECAREGCGSGAFARVTRTASHLLFTPPDTRGRAPSDVLRSHPLLLAHGALALPLDRWSQLVDRAAVAELALPSETTFQESGWRELWAAWVAPLPPLLRRLEPRAFAEALVRTLPERLHVAQEGQLAAIAQLVRWFRTGCVEGAASGLVEAQWLQTRVHSLVFDERRGERWSAFASTPSGEIYPAFGPGLVLVTDPAPARLRVA